MWEYVVGGVIGIGGTAFAFFNAWVTERDEHQREADAEADRAERRRLERPAA